jgi:hypothetical protein
MTTTDIPQSNPSANHHPDMPPRPDTGRGPDGRFAKGNAGGPGNPFARQVAAMRQEFFAAVTKEDIAVIARALLEKAKQGDVAAARLVLQYTLGRPAEAVDPDRLDEMEWQQWQREKVDADSAAGLGGIHVSTVNTLARGITPVIQKVHFAEMKRQIDESEQRYREDTAEREREAQREAQRQARRAERQNERAETRPATTEKVAAPVPFAATKVERPHEGAGAASVSSTEAQKADQGGQELPPEGCAAAAERVLRMLGGTVNKPGQTARRAANDFDD